jgi:hypothetical protein
MQYNVYDYFYQVIGKTISRLNYKLCQVLLLTDTITSAKETNRWTEGNRERERERERERCG